MATSYDFSPLCRSSVGFDRVFNHWKTQRARSVSDWPPYGVVKTGHDSYRISVAVAGFAQDDFEITFQSNLLTITGRHLTTATCTAALLAGRSNTASNWPIMSG